jgi:ketosteroid isomerase-like protein
MRRIALVVAGVAMAALTFACSPAGQSSNAPEAAAAPESTENVPQVIEGLERQWAAAILTKDTALINRLLDEDFVGMTDNVRYTKTEAIEDVTQGVHEMLTLNDISVHVFGDTAVSTMEQMEKSRHGDEDFSGQSLFMDVWVKRDGEWRAVASNGAHVR